MRHLLAGSAVAGLLFLLPVGDANAQDNRNTWGWGAAGGVLTFIAGSAVGGIMGWRLSKLAFKGKRDDEDDKIVEPALTKLNSSVKTVDTKLENVLNSINGLTSTLENKIDLEGAIATVSTSLEKTLEQQIIKVEEIVERAMNKKEDSQMEHSPFISDKMIENHNQLRPIIIETNAIIDGRIVNLLSSDLLEQLKGKILVTKLMKNELNSPTIQRKCMIRGYENLYRLCSNMNHRIEENNISYDSKTMNERLMQLTSDTEKKLLECLSDADKKFFLLASDTNGILITMDINLENLCHCTNVRVLNLDGLYKTIKPKILFRGQHVDIYLAMPGKRSNQAIGYAEHGQAVAVNEARELIGQKKTVKITGSTPDDRLFFAELSSPAEKPPTVKAEDPKKTPPAP